MANIPFLKKLTLPQFSFHLFSGKPNRIVGIDVGAHSVKVVQLKYAEERAILETYGELLSDRYLKSGTGEGYGFLRYQDSEVAELVKDVLHESNILTNDTVMSIPATTTFVASVPFPKLSREEIEKAIPYEARKYVPIPTPEVVLDWELIENVNEDLTEVLLVAVPREVIEKLKRVSGIAKLNLLAIEVETFSIVRSLVGQDQLPTALINIGSQSTTLALVDKGRLRASHNISRGAKEWTKALERGLNINEERAEAIKQEVGLSERIEEREITSVITPLVQILFSELQRIIAIYNRKAPRKIQKANITGGGSNLKGIIDYTTTIFGIETTKGNPFARVVAPAFLQPTLREIGPSFSVAVGLALRETTTR